jgi:hypothetical protein
VERVAEWVCHERRKVFGERLELLLLQDVGVDQVGRRGGQHDSGDLTDGARNQARPVAFDK